MTNTLHDVDFFFSMNVIFSYRPVLVFLFIFLIFLKIRLIFLANSYKQYLKNQTTLNLFMISLATYTIGEFAWLIKIFGYDYLSKIVSSFAWHMQPIQFYSLAIFLHGMIKKNYILGETERAFLKIFIVFIPLPAVGFLLDFFGINFFSEIVFFQNFLEPVFFRVNIPKQIIIGMSGMCFLISNMLLAAVKTRDNNGKDVPYLLQLQLRSFLILLSTFVIPEFILMVCYFIPTLDFLVNNILFTILSSVLFTASLMFYARKIYQLRFLNLTPSVRVSTEKIRNDELRKAKQVLCVAQSITELHHINAEYFEKAHGIDQERIIFLIRTLEFQKQLVQQHSETAIVLEKFIQEESEIVAEFFTEDSVLIFDEFAFTYFYQQSEKISKLLTLLIDLQVAVLIPLKQTDRIIGFIMIKKDLTQAELFPQSVQTQMGLYGTYVTYTIMRLEQYQYKNLLSERERLLQELRKTEQKVARYQESFSSIVSVDDIKRQGIVLYKSGIFTFVNTAAEELVQINPNLHHGHPLCKALKEVVRRVTLYGNPHAIVEKNMLSLEICCHGFPYKKDEVFILVSPADIMRILKLENMMIKPADIDYLVFLHSTEAGTLINTALPGKGELLQKFKIQFLKTILSKKSMVFDVHPEDLSMFLNLAQRILLRQTLHTIDIQEAPPTDVICKKIFGLQTFNIDSATVERGLLDRLDESGILCIHNAHLMDLKTQDLLTQYMKTGLFTVYKSEQQVSSNAIVILSSQEDLAERTKNGLFSKALFEQIHDSTVSFVPLALLPFSELESLAEGMQKQMIAITEYHHLFGFSKMEREQLDSKRPCSIHELQQILRIQLKQKMKSGPVSEDVKTDHPTGLIRHRESNFTDSILIEAARLGKQALKDRKIMRALWEKLKSQSKIAQLLDVDRSSVHRRFKEFGFGTMDTSSHDVN